MPYSFPPDVNELVCAYVVREVRIRGRVTPRTLQALSEEEEDLAAVRESIGDWLAGDPGIPLDAAFAAIRSRHQPGQVP